MASSTTLLRKAIFKEVVSLSKKLIVYNPTAFRAMLKAVLYFINKFRGECITPILFPAVDA